MHALALVLGDVETAMEPYDENLTVEPFWEPYDTEWLLKRWPQFRSLVTAHFLLERFQKEWAEEGDLYRVSPDGKGIEYWTDSNPAGRWDYWSTGGRFSDHLMLKPNHRGIHGERSSGSVPVRGHGKVPGSGQVEVPGGGRVKVPTPCSSCRSGA
jgi:hypothetical protein